MKLFKTNSCRQRTFPPKGQSDKHLCLQDFVFYKHFKLNNMKNLTIAIAITALLFSCKKTDVPSSTINPNQPIGSVQNFDTSRFSFNVDGKTITGYTQVIETNELGMYLQIGGNSSFDNLPNPQYNLFLQFKLPSKNNIVVGNYYTSSDSSNAFVYGSQYSAGQYDYYGASVGIGSITMRIDSFNVATQFIYCTFSGTIKNTQEHPNPSDTSNHVITNGVVYGTIFSYN